VGSGNLLVEGLGEHATPVSWFRRGEMLAYWTPRG
jgi:hypothetical protein